MVIRELSTAAPRSPDPTSSHSDPVPLSDLTIRECDRRAFLRLGYKTASVIAVAGTPLAALGERTAELSPLFLLGQDGVFRHPLNNFKTTYRPESFAYTSDGQKQRHIVRLGDSLADGYTAPTFSTDSVAEKVTRRGETVGITFLPVDEALSQTRISHASEQLDLLPAQVIPGVPIEITLSTGANDLIMKIDAVKKSLLGLKGNEWRILFEKHERMLYDAIADIQSSYRTDILDKIAALRNARMPIDKVSMIGVPNLSHADLTYDKKEEGVVYHYDPQHGNPIEKFLGASVPYLLNTALANEVVDFHERTGIDVMLLDTFSIVPHEMMYGFHPTSAGYLHLALQFMDKSLYAGPDGTLSLQEMTLRGRRV